jgi:hypothetical protein
MAVLFSARALWKNAFYNRRKIGQDARSICAIMAGLPLKAQNGEGKSWTMHAKKESDLPIV